MFVSEVEEWLYSIGLDDLYPYFHQDGFTTLDAVRQMRQSDIDAIVDRKGLMVVLNDEIDRLNSSIVGLGPKAGSVYQDRTTASQARVGSQFDRASSARFERDGSYFESEYDYEPSESLIQRYENRGIPAVGFASRHLARRAKSKARKHRGASIGVSRASAERYVPNSASDAYESMFMAKRAASVAAASARDTENSSTLQALQERQRLREEERERRAKSEMNYLTSNPEGLPSENLDKSRFREHFANDYVWVEKNHITAVGVKYDGLSRKVDHKPSSWRCEDEIERGKEYKRMNDECADKIADNRYSIDNSRDWLVDEGGVVDRVHRMSAKTAKTRYDLDSIRRKMDNLKAMRTRLLH
jgi:hypothetical protein